MMASSLDYFFGSYMARVPTRSGMTGHGGVAAGD